MNIPVDATAKFTYTVAPPKVTITVRKPDSPLLPATTCREVVPIDAPITLAEAVERWTPQETAPSESSRNFSTIIGDVQYIVGDEKEGVHLSQERANASGLIQMRVSYLDFKRMEHNTFCHQRSEDVIELPPPKRKPETIAIAGFSQFCTVVNRFGKWGDRWVTVQTCIGVPMTYTVKEERITVLFN